MQSFIATQSTKVNTLRPRTSVLNLRPCLSMLRFAAGFFFFRIPVAAGPSSFDALVDHFVRCFFIVMFKEAFRVITLIELATEIGLVKITVQHIGPLPLSFFARSA